MVPTLISAVVTCVAALFLGQAALRLSGAKSWSWLAPPVGISIGMLFAAPAIQVPGRSATTAVVLGVLTIAATIWCLRSAEHRPPLGGLLAATPVAFLVLVPFLAAGRPGILGTGLSNDMAPHMAWAEAILSKTAADVRPLPPEYPLGPHALVATITKGLGLRIDQGFAGWTMALPLLNAWTAQALCRRASWAGRLVAATVVGIPFLIAAYYGQGAFKEVVLAGLVLAMALLLSGCGPALGRGRWVPFALLTGGALSVYSVPGLPWPVVLIGLWLLGLGWLRVSRFGVRVAFRGVGATIRAELPALGIGLAVLFLTLLPQLPQIKRFVQIRGGTGIAVDDLGNVFGALPGWEAFGVWNTADYRLPADPAFEADVWTALVLAAALIGAAWAFRSRRWMLPLAAAGAMAIWAVSGATQSPYVSAKALVIASPLILALAVLPLIERDARRWLPGWWVIAPVLALALLARVGVSDLEALRFSPVGPTDHLSELRSLRPALDGKPTLFLGDDDYVKFELAGIPLGTPTINGKELLPTRPQKRWEAGEALDFDSVDAPTLNKFAWVITTRDAAGSEPPPQMHLARTTSSYAVWRRVGEVRERSVLAEGGEAGKVLDCDSAKGREILRAGGVAAVRPRPVVVPAPSVPVGTTASLQLPLPHGAWEIEAPYTSGYPVEVSAPGMRATLPANLDRTGPRWRIGVVDARAPSTRISFDVGDAALSPVIGGATLGSIVATPVTPERVVPVDRACGRYVDWFRTEAPAARQAAQ